MPDYVFPGVGSDRLATGVAGFVGTLCVFAAGIGIGRLMSGGRSRGAPGASAGAG